MNNLAVLYYFCTQHNNKMKNNKINILIPAALILLAAISRIVCNQMHWYNFAPIAAVGLFSGAALSNKKYALLFPLLGQLLADVYFQLFTGTPGFYDVSQLFVYGSLVLVTLLGTRMQQPGVLKVAGYSVAGSLIFFILSNFGVWCSIQYGVDIYGYGKGWHGLVTTYTMAIPFFQKSLVADLMGNALFFSVFYLLQQLFISKLQKAKA